jgi:ferric-dicitrate binding protein FerR (iron transport regulator)
MDDADALRARLRDARAAEPAELHESAHERIVEHMRLHGPAQVSRSRRRRGLLRAAAAALPLALLGGWLGLGGERTREAGLARDAGASATPAACARRDAPRPLELAQSDGTRRIDLGKIGQIVLAEDSVASLESSDPCSLRLQLVRGRASVHAANLFGGELRVHAGSVEVAVHGTTFAVERIDADEVLVDVESGAVSVERAGQRAGALLRTGERMRLPRSGAPIVSPLAEESRRRLRASFDVALLARHAPPVVATRALAPPAHVNDALGGRAKPPSVSARMSDDAPSVRARGDVASALDRPVSDAPDSPLRAADPDAPRAPVQAPALPARASTPVVAPVAAAPLGARSPKETSRESSPQPTAAAAPAPGPSAAALVARADAQWQAGELEQARASYHAAGVLRGPTAEAAWLALARNELAAGRVMAARSALASHARNFPDGALAGEAAGIALRVALQARDLGSAERIARQLLEDHPGTPQAAAAERWLRSREAP